jgi:hypothetical protein
MEQWKKEMQQPTKKFADTGKKRTERKIECEGVGSGCQCVVSASKGGREVAM